MPLFNVPTRLSHRGKLTMTTPTTPADRAADRREKGPLALRKRARRARGVKPRPKAKQPWLRRHFSPHMYRRKKKARAGGGGAGAHDAASGARPAGSQITQLRADLERATRFATKAQCFSTTAGVSCGPGARRDKARSRKSPRERDAPLTRFGAADAACILCRRRAFLRASPSAPARTNSTFAA